MSDLVRPRAPLEDREAAFLVEDGAPWSGRRILTLAARIRDVVPPAGPDGPVGVCSPSAGFVAAAALALWAQGRWPLLLDPGLRQEPEAVFKRYPGLAVLSDRPVAFAPQAVVVAEGAGDPLDPAWPEGARTAAQFLTSGSSGEPKLIAKRADQLFHQMAAELGWLGVAQGVGVYCLTPPFHILGFVYGLFLPLLGRGRTASSPQAMPAGWVRAITELRPDLVVGVPAQFRALAHHAKGPLPPALYFSSGAPLSPDIDAAFRERTGQAITQGYGSTETGGIAKRSGFGAWRPFPELEWRIAPEDGRLIVRSPWQEQPDEWHVCDDIVSPEGDGFVLLGRADSVVKVGGKRFSTDEVVRAAQACPGVGEAEAVAFERFGETAVALFATAPEGATLTAAGLRAALAEKLAGFKVPRAIEVLAEMPRLSNGKVDRMALKRKAGVGSRAGK